MAKISPQPAVDEPCATCGFPLVTEKGATPWCANCGWNLDYFDIDKQRPEIGWRRVDRATFRLAYDLNSQDFSTLSGRPVERIGYSWIKALLTAMSIGLMALVVAMAAFAVWVIVDLHNFIGYFFGGVLLCVAGALRPRFGKLEKYADPVSESDAPALHRLIREVAAATGAPAPHTVLWSTAFNAYSSAYGFRRRRVVSIGLPLWISLSPQQRVALLGHELGHFVNGDVRRGPLTSLVFRTFDTLSSLTRPDRRAAGRYGRGAAGLADVIARLVMSFLHTVFWVAQLVIDAVAMRATHRAEYAADQIASSAAGSAAASGLLDVLLLSEPCVTVLRRAARTDPDNPQAWHKAVATSVDTMSPRLPRLRQLSMREQASLFRTHPPAGLRSQMTASRPQTSAKVVLTESDALRIDQELAKQLRSMRSTLIN